MRFWLSRQLSRRWPGCACPGRVRFDFERGESVLTFPIIPSHRALRPKAELDVLHELPGANRGDCRALVRDSVEERRVEIFPFSGGISRTVLIGFQGRAIEVKQSEPGITYASINAG